MSVTKYIAGTTAPTSGDAGISPEANQNTMICIGFSEMEVYGKSGSSWELIGTSTAED